PSADTVLGPDAGRGADNGDTCPACRDLPGPRDRPDRARAQPAGRRAARPAGPPLEGPGMSLLAVHDLSLSLGGRPLLRSLTFDILPGEVFGLVGESGSGKSMTALALMGLCPEGAAVTG